MHRACDGVPLPQHHGLVRLADRGPARYVGRARHRRALSGQGRDVSAHQPAGRQELCDRVRNAAPERLEWPLLLPGQRRHRRHGRHRPRRRWSRAGHRAGAGVCRDQLGRRPLRLQRRELWHRLSSPPGLRLPGHGQADADGQGPDRCRLRKGPRPLVHRRLLERGTAHVRRDDTDASGVRRLPGGRARLPPPARGHRQPVRGKAIRNGRDGSQGSGQRLHRRGARDPLRRGAGPVRCAGRRPGWDDPGHHAHASPPSTSRATCLPAVIERDGRCLSAAQKRAIAPIFSGAVDGKGEAFYASFPVRQRAQQLGLGVLGVPGAPPDRLGRHRPDLGRAASESIDVRRPRLCTLHTGRRHAEVGGGHGRDLSRVCALLHVARAAHAARSAEEPGREGPGVPRRERRDLFGQRYDGVVRGLASQERWRRFRLRAVFPSARHGPLCGRTIDRPVRHAHRPRRLGRERARTGHASWRVHAERATRSESTATCPPTGRPAAVVLFVPTPWWRA